MKKDIFFYLLLLIVVTLSLLSSQSKDDSIRFDEKKSIGTVNGIKAYDFSYDKNVQISKDSLIIITTRLRLTDCGRFNYEKLNLPCRNINWVEIYQAINLKDNTIYVSGYTCNILGRKDGINPNFPQRIIVWKLIETELEEYTAKIAKILSNKK